MVDRPATERDDAKVVVTPEMIEAGVSELSSFNSEFDRFEDVAVRVFLAMIAARQAREGKGREEVAAGAGCARGRWGKEEEMTPVVVYGGMMAGLAVVIDDEGKERTISWPPRASDAPLLALWQLASEARKRPGLECMPALKPKQRQPSQATGRKDAR